ncbi:hypothetical protein B566_EDAN016641 [Ephemera danica]|nr:hypothetical protein B566_EDAN016641 [Ephemera danica]
MHQFTTPHITIEMTSAAAGQKKVEISEFNAEDDPFQHAKAFSTEKTDDISLEILDITNKNNNKLFCRYWKPAGDVRALVLLMHGYAEHLQWYHHVGMSLAQEGCLAFGHDHLDDALLHVNKMQSSYPNIPTFLMGHSMGGLVALLTAVKQPNIFKGVVLNGPFVMLGEDVRSPFKKWCARTFCKILPNAQVGSLNMDFVTGDKQMVEKINADPLWWKGGVKLKTGAAFLNAVEKVSAHFPKMDFPFLIIHGADDKICDPEGSQNIMKESPSKDKLIKMYPAAEHHLYLDKKSVRDQAVQDTVEWICQRV